MSSGKRYSRLETERVRKLNYFKVIIAALIVLIAIFGIYKLATRGKNVPKFEKKELGREIINKNEVVTEVKEKTIDDYFNDYGAVLIEKVKNDTYYVSVEGKESTLYSDGSLVEGKIPLWSGESKEVKIDKDTKIINISSAEELKWIADQVITGERNFSGITINLNNNLDLGGRLVSEGNIEGTRWNSIIGFLDKAESTTNTPNENEIQENVENIDNNEEKLKGFAGTFDGGNHFIKGLVIESDNNYQGLFGYISGTVKNLVIKDSFISGKDGVGAIVGLSVGKVENCKINNVSIKGNNKIGGFVGIGMTNSSIDRCETEDDKSKVDGKKYVGGIVGYLNNNSNIVSCVNKSSISGEDFVGGITGISFFGSNISSCFNNSEKINGNDYVGGISGYSQSQIEKCYNISRVSGNSYVGGITGVNYTMGNIHSTYNKGDITGNSDFIGGITGANNATVVSTYNTGKVIQSDLNNKISIGGICGQNLAESAINNSYNIGDVSGNGFVGGIIGANFGMTSNCYYLNSTVKVKSDEAKSEEEMKGIGLDEDFKEDSSNLNNGYPVLAWQ